MRWLERIKASHRYAAKMDSEGAQMYDAAKALKEAMISLGLACDGGKDSLSMAATAGSEVNLLSEQHLVLENCPPLFSIVYLHGSKNG